MFTPTGSPSKKRLKFAPSAVLGESSRNAANINWAQCCLCGERAGVLKCPAENPVASQRYAGYKTLATLLPEFEAEGLLPNSINLKALRGEAESLVASLIHNKARWHNACGLQYNRQALTRAKCQRTKENRKVKKEPSTPSPVTPVLGKRTRTPKTPVPDAAPPVCLLCGEGPAWNNRLVQLTTSKVEERLVKIGQTHPDPCVRGSVAGILSQGSLLRKDLKVRYHNKCLLKCTSEAAPKETGSSGMHMCEAIAFAEIVRHIQDEMSRHGSSVVFKLGVLGKMYNDRLGVLLGVDPSTLPPVHGTRLRERILQRVTDLEARFEGREYFLIPSSAAFLNAVMEDDLDDSAIVFDRFVRLMRKELDTHTCHFTGNLNPRCQEESIPPVLLAMCSKILFGSLPTTMNRSTQPAVTLAQLILFNFKKYRRAESNILRHQKDREPPLPVFLGLSTWGRSRMRGVIDTSHSLGLSVSSFRVREITSALSQWVADRAEHDGAVIPANLVVGVFTVICYDNIDWNPSSNTARDSFHGTGMSVLQMPTADKPGLPLVLMPPEADFAAPPRRAAELPNFYSTVKKVVLHTPKPLHTILEHNSEQMFAQDNTMAYWKREENWLSHVAENYTTPLENLLNFSWSGYHAAESGSVNPGINSLLPLFYEDSNDVAMVVHGMEIADSTVQRLNPGQPTVFCCDQPLFATAKIAMWNFPTKFPEGKMFVMFGSFHIEQNFLRVIGQLMEGCGLIKILGSSDLYTEQAVQSLIAVQSVKKSRAMHHVLASVLYILLQEAYSDENPEFSFEKWLEERAAASDLFYFWLLILNLQILLFRFIWALRTRTYSEYCEALKAMVPWFFACDRHNYARWLSVHVKDIAQLPEIAPNLHNEFQMGNFSFPISSAKLSCVGFDQVHEQNNKIIKGDGGAVGLSQDPDALRRWMIAGPEVQRLLQDFEGRTHTETTLHHEQYPAFQENCRRQVQGVRDCFIAFRNPFLDSPKELLALDSLIVVGDEGSASLRSLESSGMRQYVSFVDDRLSSRKIDLFQPIKRNNFRIFASAKKRIDGRLVSIRALEADVELFSRLYMMAGTRQLDYNVFFRYENQSCPPSLSKDGSLYPAEKFELIPVLEKYGPASSAENVLADTVIFDGAALIHMLRPRHEKTFSDYWKKSLQDYVDLLRTRYGASRVDIVWDLYFAKSIKRATRDARGVGIRRKVLGTSLIPIKSWSDFLQNDENKAELFRLLAYDSLKQPPKSDLFVTNVGDTIVTAEIQHGRRTSLSGVSCGDMEEADGRLILHLADAVQNGCKKAVIRSVDTDVLVLAISFCSQLFTLGLEQLWLHLGTGKSQKLIPCHTIASAFGHEKSIALRGFHAFSGCDFTSGFRGKRKVSMWSNWESFPEATKAFFKISETIQREEIDDNIIQILEKFVILLYATDFPASSLDEHRLLLYTKKGKKLQDLPPTLNVLRCHILRSAYVSGQIWGQCARKAPTVPSPVGWGWTEKGEKLQIEWSTIPPIWEAARKLLAKCGCTTGCSGKRCICWTSRTGCTIFCRCTGCQNEKPPEPSLQPEADDQDADDPDAVIQSTSR